MKVQPILATERTAAALLDLSVDKFRELVRFGYLPKPRIIAPGVLRWDVAALQAIASGLKVEGGDPISW